MANFLSSEVQIALSAANITPPDILIASSLRDEHFEILPEGELAIVCDANTRPFARAQGRLIELPGTPAPDEATAAHLRARAEGCKALVAVGSGTINDLCKFTAHAMGLPYAAIPTAPSMNGYTSANASIIGGGHKTSRPARLPAAVLCGLDVIASAPIRLRRAGLGDSLARPTAQADWLLSHLLRGTHYDHRPFTWLTPYEPELLANPSNTENLLRVLLLSGLGMTLTGGSHPASEGEHMIVHHYEETYGSAAYHGEAVGVATLTMARLQHQLLSLPKLAPYAERLSAVMLPPETLERALTAIGAPTTPEALGWDPAAYEKIVHTAYATRDRFTFLNLIPPLP